jgi:hypothetical protein
MAVNGMARSRGSDAPRDARFSLEFAGRCGCATHRESGVLGGAATGISLGLLKGNRADRFVTSVL